MPGWLSLGALFAVGTLIAGHPAQIRTSPIRALVSYLRDVVVRLDHLTILWFRQ
jgi:hypothetical protein